MKSNPIFGSAHRDVLEATIPVDSVSRTILLNELKNRGKGAVQAKQWPDAAALYRKALEVATDQDDSEQQGILNSNLSLVLGKMNQWTDALEAAQGAVKADESYVKGWWRLGQAQFALESYPAAVTAMEQAKTRDPTNKALQKELDKFVVAAKKAEEEAARKAAEAEAMEVDGETTDTKKTVVRTEVVKENSKNHNNNADPKPMKVDGEDFTKSDHVKGYKIVNGKKTSYFHNELSKEAADLIGDIAPKKLETAAAPAAAANSNTSAWNQAGTWEEKDVSAHAQETLQSSLLKVSYTLPPSSPAPNAVALVTKATADGHASVAVARGKKRYIYEYLIKLDWEFRHDTVTAKGSLAFPDVDGTCVVGEPYEALDFTIKECSDETIKPILNAFVHKQGLRDELHKCMDDWVRLLKETY